MARRTSPELYHGEMALALTLLGALALLLVFHLPFRVWYYPLAAWLVAVNLTTFGYYGYDKARAGSGRRRVPELVLHGLVLAGGTLGGYAGMWLFRHKTLKGPFRLVFWWIVVLQLALIATLSYRAWKRPAPERSACSPPWLG
jgi:uncharacterized membrane protein YsdA (DUF1294 family)